MVELGHRRVALLAMRRDPDPPSDPADWAVVRARTRGWREVLGPAGIEPVEVLSPDNTQEAGAATVARLPPA